MKDMNMPKDAKLDPINNTFCMGIVSFGKNID